jgi:hypothetical protein
MGTTANLKLPYPEAGDGADGPAALSALSQAIEDYFFSRSLPTGVTRMPNYYWGAGTAFPTGAVQPGDSFTRTDLGALYVFVGGTSWVAQRATFVQTADPGAVPDGTVWFQPAS